MPIALTSDACTQMLAKKTILKGARRDDVPLVVLLPKKVLLREWRFA